MGYKLPERTSTIRFENTDYDGAEVTLSLSITLGQYRRIAALQENQDFDGVVEVLSGFIKAWNLEDDAGPIPPTPEGFNRLSDLGFLRALLEGWHGAMQGVASVDVPLGEQSSNGATSSSKTPSEETPPS